jgi:hypothetical protein
MHAVPAALPAGGPQTAAWKSTPSSNREVGRTRHAVSIGQLDVGLSGLQPGSHAPTSLPTIRSVQVEPSGHCMLDVHHVRHCPTAVIPRTHEAPAEHSVLTEQPAPSGLVPSAVQVRVALPIVTRWHISPAGQPHCGRTRRHGISSHIGG